MALRADRDHDFRTVPPLLRKHHQPGVAGVIQIDYSVAGVTMKAERGERPGRCLHRCRVAARAAVREHILLPYALAQDRELPVAFLLEKAYLMSAAQKELCVVGRPKGLDQVRRVLTMPDSHTVRVLLPGRSDVVAVAEEALVAMDALRQRPPYMIAAPHRRITRLRGCGCH